jgi:hypothetical protein
VRALVFFSMDRTRHISHRLMLPTRLTRVVVVALAVVAVACGDLTKPKASTPNLALSYTLSAFTGGPVNVANAINFLGGSTRADSRFAFDIALDLDPAGNVEILPVRYVAGSLGTATHLQQTGVPLKRVGLQKVTGPFEALREAPATGYDTLSVQTITPGIVLAVELLDFANCYTGFGGSTLYAKLTVDSVDAYRRIYTRTVADPNCGYRGLVPDSIPTR